MSETAQEYLLLFAGIVLFVGYWIVRGVVRTTRMNNDPLQKELAALLIEYANSDWGDGATSIFTASTFRACAMRMVVEPREQQNRLVHALSMARPMLTAQQYEFVRLVLRP